MLVTSTIYPAEIRLETVLLGIATLRVRWNVNGTLIDGKLYYQYQEAIIKKVLPATYVSNDQTISIYSRSDVENYLVVIKEDLISQAKMANFEV